MTVENTTSNRGYPLPDATNKLNVDVLRLLEALAAIDVDVAAVIAGLLTKSNVGHGHAIADVSGLQTALDEKLAASATIPFASLGGLDIAGAANNMFLRFVNGTWVPVSFDAAMVASGRFGESRLPTYLAQSVIDGKAAAVHTHAISDVTNLQALLDMKAGASHGHAISDIINLTATLNSLSSQVVQPGSVVPYAGPNAPSGWLPCDGRNVSRTGYAALFAAISTYHGGGDGSTTFALPDLRGRVIAGYDTLGGAQAYRLYQMVGGWLGAVGGAELHTLSWNEMPAHTHTFATGPGSGSGKLGYSGGGSGTVTTSSSGANYAHNNVQPTIALNYIIKT